jgi:hypothetical protein
MSDRSFSSLLRTKLGTVVPTLQVTSTEVFFADEFPDRYVEFLCLQHEILRASVPLMEFAMARAAGRRGQSDDEFRDYLARHCEEERHHDEWLLDDLSALGHDATQLTARVPRPQVAAMVGTQYYWINHHDPIVVLGYIAVLESSPPTPDFLAEVIQRSGISARAFRTLLSHADLDPHHLAELDDVIDRVVRTEDGQRAVSLSALTTACHLANVFDSFNERVSKERCTA